MTEEFPLPAPLADVVADFEFVDRALRAEMLVEYADRFREVPADVAARPFPESRRAANCESRAFCFSQDRPDGTLDLYFAVENPQGISARAWAVILAETLSAQPLAQVVAVPDDTAQRIFGRDLAMGRALGLAGMLELVRRDARSRLALR